MSLSNEDYSKSRRRAQDAEARQRERALLLPRGRAPLTNKQTNNEDYIEAAEWNPISTGSPQKMLNKKQRQRYQATTYRQLTAAVYA